MIVKQKLWEQPLSPSNFEGVPEGRGSLYKKQKKQKMTTINRISEFQIYHKTPEVFNADNPVQAKGAARGREWHPTPHNPVGVEHQPVPSCAPTEHRDRALHPHTPSCASLARGYHSFASYGGERHPIHPPTVALGYCLDRYALSERPNY